MYIIDFHSHILPGVDDGSLDLKMSEIMLQMAYDQGVNVQVLTPHFYPHKMGVNDFLNKRNIAINALAPIAQRNKIHIRYGAEVAYFSTIGQSEEITKFLINGTNLLLIEMPFDQWTEKEVKNLDELLKRGIVPIIAHLDRYISYQHDMSFMNRILDLRLVSQINCECLDSFFDRRKVFKVLGRRHPFLLGSDAHNIDSRAPNMYDGRTMIAKKLGDDMLNRVDMLGNKILGYKVIKK